MSRRTMDHARACELAHVRRMCLRAASPELRAVILGGRDTLHRMAVAALPVLNGKNGQDFPPGEEH